MNTKVMFSSNSDEWATPEDFFDTINQEFHFNLDPCATSENHKCEKFFTMEQNGLNMDWGGVSCVLQSTIFEDCRMGCEVLRRRLQRKHTCVYANSGKDRHKIFSRLHLESFGSTIHKRSIEVWTQ